MTSTTKPTLADAIANAMSSASANIRVGVPAIVSSYDPTTSTATIQLVVCEKRQEKDAITKRTVIKNYCVPAIAGVPVAFFGTERTALTCQLKAGDQGWAMFSHRSIAEWRAAGGAGIHGITAQDTRRFSFSDAVFLPGTRPPANPLVDPEATTTDDATVLWAADELRLGASTATDWVALSSLVDAQLAALQAAVVSAFQAGALAAVPGDGGTAAMAAAALSLSGLSLSSTAATRVKAL